MCGSPTETPEILQAHEMFAAAAALCIVDGAARQVDCHGHSCCSDGRYSLELVADSLPIRSTAFVTDHNTLTHFRQLEHMWRGSFLDNEALPHLIPGVEFTFQLADATAHAIWLGGNTTVHLRQLVECQRRAYLVREHERLSLVSAAVGSSIDVEPYERFCAGRTPNWTLTYNYIQALEGSGRLPAGAAELTRRGQAAGVEQLGRTRLPSLAELMAASRASQATLFLCHVGDLVNKLGVGVVEAVVEAHQDLLLDLSESTGVNHTPTAPAVAASAALSSRASCFHLIGSDFHDAPPLPRAAPRGMHHFLVEKQLLALHHTDAPALELMPFLPACLMLVGGDKLDSLLDIAGDLPNMTVGQWCDKWASDRQDFERSEIVEAVCSFAVLRGVFTRAVGRRVARESTVTAASVLIAGLGDMARGRFDRDRSTPSAAFVMAVADVAQRLCLGPLAESLMAMFGEGVPPAFRSLYEDRGGEVECHQAVQALWLTLRDVGDRAWLDSQLLWRRKSLVAAYSSVLRSAIQHGPHRSGLSEERARDSAHSLLRGLGDMSSLESDYRNIVYDHLGVTFVLPKEDVDYSVLLGQMQQLPCEIRDASWEPRQAYHRRLWFRTELGGGSRSPIPTEVMVKTPQDFLVGRAYQWYVRGVRVATTSSPWLAAGTFDRDVAVQNLSQHRSAVDALLEELRTWASHGDSGDTCGNGPTG